MTNIKCPHCGTHLHPNPDALTPTHSYPPNCRQVCPGSHQAPRTPQDPRPLWKDLKHNHLPTDNST